MRRETAFVALITVGGGCISTDYVGRDPRKVYVTMQDGQRGYTRGGVFHNDVFGGGLEEVVAGNPQAAQAADTFHSRMVGGFVATMVGAVCMPVAFGYAITQDSTFNDGGNTSNSRESTAGLVALGCLGLMIGGAIALGTAQPYQLDAINIYNDGVDAMGAYQPYPRYAAPPPVPGLRMQGGPVAPPAPPAPMAPPEPPMAPPGGP